MPEDPSIRHQIDLICDRFEKSLQHGQAVNFRDFLEEVDVAHRPSLFRELLILASDYQSETAQRDFLLRQFPEYSNVIRELFSVDHDSDPDQTLESGSNAAQPVSGFDQTMATNLTPNNPSRPPVIQRGSTIKYIGDYEIKNEIARGGMGVVYHACQKSLGRDVALKMILSGELAGDHEVARFHSEAESAATLDHPYIVPIYEVGQHEQQHYFSMGLIVGPSLSSVLRDGPMDQHAAVRLIQKIAEAIDYAHDKGIIHRDLKPANILLDENGDPHVTDFGLAKRTSSAAELTSTGQVLGTPAYMPPEQARGETDKIGPPSDIYSLGAILYSTLAGRPPHAAASAVETLRQVVEVEPLSVRSLNPSTPKDLETICQKCLDKDPSRRYQTAGALADELGRFLRGEPIHARPISRIERAWRWSRRHPAFAALSAAVIFLTATLAIGGPVTAITQSKLRKLAQFNQRRAETLATRERESREQVEVSRAELAAQNDRSDHALYARTISLAHQQWESGNLISAEDLLASLPTSERGFEWHYVDSLLHRELHRFATPLGNPRLAAITADNQHLIVSEKGSNPKLSLYQFGSHQPIETHDVAVIAINREGSKAAVVEATNLRRLKLIDPISGNVISEFDIDNGITDRASLGGPNDSRLAVAFNDQTVRVLDMNSGKELINIKERNRRRIHPIAMSPDGKTLAWRRSDDGVLEIRDAMDGDTIFSGFSSALATDFPVAYSPDSKRLVVGDVGAARIVRATDGQTIGFLDGLKGSTLSVNFSPDGNRIVATCEDGIVRVYDATEYRLLTKLIGHRAGSVYGIYFATFDSSGNRIISCGADGDVKVWDAWCGDRAVAAFGSGQSHLGKPAPSQQVGYLTGFKDRVEGLQLSKDGERVFAASRDRSVRVFDSQNGNLIRKWDDLNESLSSIDHDFHTGMVVVGGGSITDKQPGGVIALDFDSGKELWRFEDTNGPIADLKIFDEGKRVAVGVGSQAITTGELFVLDATDGELVWKSQAVSAPVIDLDVSADGSRIVSVGQNPGIDLHEAESGEWQGRCGDKRYYAVALNESGDLMATGSLDWNVSLFDLKSGDQTWNKLRHNGAVLGITFTADDSRIVSTSLDGTTRIWDTSYGDLILTMEDSGTEKYEVAASADGSLLVTSGKDNNVKIRRTQRRDQQGSDEWLPLVLDDFDRKEIGEFWNPVSGLWEIEEGRLKGIAKASTMLPGTFEAMISCVSVQPHDVEVSMDVEIDRPLMLQTILSETTSRNMLVGDFIGVPGTHLNHGSTGASVVAMRNGRYAEEASRRGGGFDFEVGKKYRLTTRRIGSSFQLLVDGKLYRAVEVGMDAPVPLFTLQNIFGGDGSAVWIDNFSIKVPPSSAAEVQAAKVVIGLIDQFKLSPIVSHAIESASEESLLINSVKEPFEDLPLATEVRRLALELAKAWPLPPDDFKVAATMAAENKLTAEQFAVLHRWTVDNAPSVNQASLTVQAMTAYRAGDLNSAKQKLDAAAAIFATNHGTPHPVELAVRALVSHAEGKESLAIQQLRDTEQLSLSDRYRMSVPVATWYEIAKAKVDPPPLHADAATLARRVWEMDNQNYLYANFEPLESTLAEDAELIVLRQGEQQPQLVVSRDRWIETNRIWHSGSMVGVGFIRSHVEVDLEAKDPIVTSHYSFELNDLYINTVLRDTFSKQTDVPASQWKLTSRESRTTKQFAQGETVVFDKAKWKVLDNRVDEARKSQETPMALMRALSDAGRPQEAFSVAQQMIKDADDARLLIKIAEAAYNAYEPEIMKHAIEKALDIDGDIATFPCVRFNATRRAISEQPLTLRDDISVQIPKFYRQASVHLLAGGAAGVAAAQPTRDSLVGIYQHPGETIESFSKTLLASRAGAMKANLIESRSLTVDGFPAHTYVHAGQGIGRAMGFNGRPTMQRFVLIERENDLIAVLVSAYSNEFIFRDSEFQYFLSTLDLDRTSSSGKPND